MGRISLLRANLAHYWKAFISAITTFFCTTSDPAAIRCDEQNRIFYLLSPTLFRRWLFVAIAIFAPLCVQAGSASWAAWGFYGNSHDRDTDVYGSPSEVCAAVSDEYFTYVYEESGNCRQTKDSSQTKFVTPVCTIPGPTFPSVLAAAGANYDWGSNLCFCPAGGSGNASGYCVYDFRISLSGPSSTRALPAGPSVSLLIQITKDRPSQPAVFYEPFSVKVTDDKGSMIVNGTTDFDGLSRLNYVPPNFKTVAQIVVTCEHCSNTDSKSIAVAEAPATDDPEMCMVDGDVGKRSGNPIALASGSKMQDETDWSDQASHSLNFIRHYRSGGNLPVAGLDNYWSHNYAAKLSGNELNRSAFFGNGTLALFTRTDTSSAWINDNGGYRLTQNDSGWLITRRSDDSFWQFDNNGALTSISQRDGWVMNLTYTNGALTQVANPFGRSLSLAYDSQNRLSSITTPGGNIITYLFDGMSRHTGVRYADNSSKAYLYESSNFPFALTGINDETGQRYATFSYDEIGRATGTAHAGGVQSYTAIYPPAKSGYLGTANGWDQDWFSSTTQVLDPRGNTQIWSYQGGNGKVRVGYASGAFDGGKVASRSFVGHSVLPEVETDFRGVQTAYTWDTERRLPLSITRAANSSGQAKQIQWHPTYALPVVVAEAGRRTTSVYNGQPDPFNDGALARCAPTTAVLPNGDPIAVLCKQVQQATTDTNGFEGGLSASLQNGVSAKIWSWVYDQNGQILVETNPLGHSSTRSYYSENSSTHREGDLQRVTNAMGHTTLYVQYDANGNLLQSTDPNGVVSNYAYNSRGSRTSISIGGQTTSYSYTQAGLISRISQPDGSYVSYSYDGAQRLIGIVDSLGNSISYTLDNAGSRTEEQVKDPGGVLRRQLSRVLDPYGRPQKTTGRE